MRITIISNVGSHMPIVKEFLEKLKSISKYEPLLAIYLNKYAHVGGELSFQDILNGYEKYFNELVNMDDKNRLSRHFWEIIDSLKCPLIEVKGDGSAQVYFLYKKQGKYESDLYVQGDYHGYGSTLDSRKLNRIGDTDLMCCITPINKEFLNSLITYHFIEVPRDKNGDPLIDLNDNKKWIPDPLAKNTKAFEKTESQFCVNADNDMSSWRVSGVREWPTFDEINKDPRLIHLAQNLDGRIVDGVGSFTDDLRSIHVFKPTEKVENIVIVNDGFAYLFCDMVNQVKHFAEKENCVFIFISPHFGLGNLGLGKLDDHELGVRGLEYHINVDRYAAFVLNELLPELNSRGVLPDPHPVNMTVIGASMSGIAALRMGLTHPEQFSRVIAHSPAPIGRDKIDEIPDVCDKSRRMQIDIECGRFETPEYAFANDNLSYSRELGKLLNVKVHVGLHGHQTEGWVADLKRSLPAVLKQELMKGKKQDFTFFSHDNSHIQTVEEEKEKNERAAPALTDKKVTDDSGITYSGYRKK